MIMSYSILTHLAGNTKRYCANTVPMIIRERGRASVHHPRIPRNLKA